MSKISLEVGVIYHIEYTTLGARSARKMEMTAQFLGPTKVGELQFNLRPEFGTVTIPQEWVDKADPVKPLKFKAPKPVK